MDMQQLDTKRSGIRIVFVEDDLLFRDALIRNLEDSGFEVQDFESGETALEYFESGGRADVALLDWKLPGIAGIDLLQRMGAKEKGIPVLIFDSALDGEPGEDFVGFIATDNLAAGKLGGKHLMELVGEGGKTILFRHMEGQQSTSLREQGALDEMKAEIADVLVENRYTGKDASEAQRTALNMIDTIREADGIFASNQTASEGLIIALQKNNLTGKVKVVGFDSSPLLVEALAKGEIDALVVQDPVNMGYMSVKAMVDHLDGKKIEPVVSTACKLVTRENMNDAEIKPLIE